MPLLGALVFIGGSSSVFVCILKFCNDEYNHTSVEEYFNYSEDKPKKCSIFKS